MVDASDLGAGAVLMQQDSKGVEHPVCYFSRKFSLHQYSTIEKEILALVLTLQHFDALLNILFWSSLIITPLLSYIR